MANLQIAISVILLIVLEAKGDCVEGPTTFDGCSGQPLGTSVSDPNSCSQFFRCGFGNFAIQSCCPSGLEFSTSDQTCVAPENSDCGLAMTTTTTTTQAPATCPPGGALSPSIYDCTGKPNGNYIVTECNNKYITCANGFAYLMCCQPNLVFNSAKNYCDYPENVVGCPTTTTTQGPTPTPETEEEYDYTQGTTPETEEEYDYTQGTTPEPEEEYDYTQGTTPEPEEEYYYK